MDRGLLFVLFVGGAFLAARAHQHAKELRRGPTRPPIDTIELSTQPDGNVDLVFSLDKGESVVFVGPELPGTVWTADVSPTARHLNVSPRRIPTPTPGVNNVEFTVTAKQEAGVSNVALALVDGQGEVLTGAVYTITVRP